MSFKLVSPEEYRSYARKKRGGSKLLNIFTDDTEDWPIAKLVDGSTRKSKAYIMARADNPNEEEGWMPGLETNDDDVIEKMPELHTGRRDSIYIVGQSGTYKSTYARYYADNFLSEFQECGEDPKVIIVCVDDPKNDGAFATLPHTWISPAELVDEFRSDPKLMTPDNVNPSRKPMLFIFDDLDGISDKETNKILSAFVEMVLTRGRKYRLHSIFISHSGTKGGTKSAVHLLESSHISVPLKHTIGQNIKYTLEKHFNLPTSLRRLLQEENTKFGPRALISAGGAPQVVITDKRIINLNPDKLDEALDEIKHRRKQARIIRTAK